MANQEPFVLEMRELSMKRITNCPKRAARIRGPWHGVLGCATNYEFPITIYFLPLAYNLDQFWIDDTPVCVYEAEIHELV